MSDGMITVNSAQIAQWASFLLSPTPLVFFISVVLVISIPLLLHLYFYWSVTRSTLPSILLIGPSGAGKTSLLSLIERGKSVQTRISQAPIAVECSLPVNTVAASDKYRSVNDPSNQVHKRFLLADTPGHGKLRQHAISSITDPQNLKGIIFMVDSSAMSGGAIDTDQSALRETAAYLHSILMLLQARALKTSSNRRAPFALLIAANKQDLFTALPAPLLKKALESEITKIIHSAKAGLLDSGIGMNDTLEDDDAGLMMNEKGQFDFAQGDQIGIRVDVCGGNAAQGTTTDINQWWKWIAGVL